MASDQHPSLNRPLQLLLVSDDPILRLGLSTALAEYSDLQIMAEADTVTATLEFLKQQHPDVLIIDFDLGQPAEALGWQLCQQIKREQPNLPILLLSRLSPQQLIAIPTFGIEGYCSKGTAITELATALRQLASGKTYWPYLAVPTQVQTSQTLRRHPWSRLRQQGLQQIDETLNALEQQLQQPQLPLFDWFFWSGRKRELLAARWIVNRLLPVEVVIVSPETANPVGAIVPLGTTANLPQSAIADPFDSTLAKIGMGIKNLTGIP